MNSERRHELQHNWLAEHLARINEWIEPHSKLIAIVVGAAIVGLLGFALVRSNASGQRSDATLQLVLAAGEGDAEVLGMVGDDYAQTTAGSWARLYQADEFMARGLRVLYTDRAEANELFDSAKAAYQQALSTGGNAVLQSRSHYGLARIAESVGDVETAIEEYRATIAADESEAMVTIAQQRIDSLSRPGTKEFLAWFGDQDFTPSDPAMPPSLPSGTALPDLPDLDLPPLDLPDLGSTPPAEENAAADENAASNENMTEDAASEPAPDATPTGEETPASDATPAPAESTEDEPAGAEALVAPANGGDTQPSEPTKNAPEAEPAGSTESSSESPAAVEEVEPAEADGESTP